MTVKGVVKDGVVVLEDGVKLHDGTEVRVEVPPPAAPLFSEKLMKFGGSLRGDYPPDFARNHDHYIHGTTKK